MNERPKGRFPLVPTVTIVVYFLFKVVLFFPILDTDGDGSQW
jgi:hypothetical protein